MIEHRLSWDSPFELSITEAAELIRAKELSPVELLRSVFERIQATEEKVHAYVAIAREQAILSARQAESEILTERWKGPLHGIPFAVKDVYLTRGIVTEAGSRLLHGFMPERESWTVARLKDAGGVLLGKTTTPEFAYYSYSSTRPYPRNPWNLDHHSGGSSAGSAVAVAAGSAMAALGTDTGGSIRKPAAFTGIVGFKPTFGSVSKRDVIPMSPTLDHCGVLTRTAHDAQVIMSELARYDPLDPMSAEHSHESLFSAASMDLSACRLGVEDELLSDSVEPEVKSIIEKGIRRFEDLGAEIDRVRIPRIDSATAAGATILMADVSAYHTHWLTQREAEYEPGTRWMLRLGQSIPAIGYIQAMRIRGAFRRSMMEVFRTRNLTALIAPTHGATAPTVIDRHAEQVSQNVGSIASLFNEYCMPFNVTGQPAVSIPCGVASNGLPVGLQIVGKPFQDGTVLHIARLFEESEESGARRPVFRTVDE